MSVRSTSRESHLLNRVSGKYPKQEGKVLSALMRYGEQGASRRQLARDAGLETSAVPRSILSLIEKNVVEESRKKYTCPVTGRTVRRVRVKPGIKP